MTSTNPYIKNGSHHTIELEAPRKFTVHKDFWDSVALDMVKEACDVKSNADLAAVVMEMGLAHLCLVTKSMTIVKSKIELSVPRKRAGSSQHEKQRDKFFEYILQALIQHIDWNIVKAVIIASPGFVKDQFYDYMLEQAQKRDLSSITENKSRFVKAKASSGHKHSLKEVLLDTSILEQLKDVKAADEVAALQKFYETFNTDASRAVYGLKHVTEANEAAAIDMLLITNELFKVQDVAMRKVYVGLIENVKAKGGNVYMFSTLHPSGEQLKGLTGIAAVLRFPLDLTHIDHELDDASSSSTDSESSDPEDEMFHVLDKSMEGGPMNSNN